MKPRPAVWMPTVSSPSWPVKGRRPTATSTTSASSTCASPPALGSTVSFTPVSETSAPVTFTPKRNFIPCLVSERWKAVATSASTPGVMRSRYSTASTSAPSRRQTEPSSSPMMPAPMTISFLGTCGMASAPVESTTRFWSTSTPGTREGSEPVAITMFLVSSVRSDPSSALTVTLPGPSMRPSPWTHSALFFLNRNSMPLVSAVTLSPFCLCIWSRSSSGSTLMPSEAKPVLASANSSEACSSALDGMQPTFRQVPPSVPRFSTQATLSPSWPARMAAL